MRLSIDNDGNWHFDITLAGFEPDPEMPGVQRKTHDFEADRRIRLELVMYNPDYDSIYGNDGIGRRVTLPTGQCITAESAEISDFEEVPGVSSDDEEVWGRWVVSGRLELSRVFLYLPDDWPGLTLEANEED